MSRSFRSYDEDWQRRKSFLIRSLFHDIPILSPVPEEFSGSLNDTREEHIRHSSPFPDPPRPFSPLPPLIIETEPNKHDDPEEYYEKLLVKIKKIYRKLFIENREFSSSDYLSQSSINDDIHEIPEPIINDTNLDSEPDKFEMQEEGSHSESLGETGESSILNNSNGYSGDLESIDSEIIDIVNDAGLNKNDDRLNENSDNTDGNKESEAITENIQKCSEEEIDNRDDDERSKRYGNECEESNEINMDVQEFSGAEEEIVIHEMDSTGDTTLVTDEQESDDEQNPTETIRRASKQSIRDEQTQEASIAITKEINILNKSTSISGEREEMAFDGGKQLNMAEHDVMNEDVVTITSSEDSDYRQITTEALVHVDGHPEVDRESQVYEDSVKSVILPTRQTRTLVKACTVIEDKIEEASALEDKDDPETDKTCVTEESALTKEEIEIMRTPRLDTVEDSFEGQLQNDSEASYLHTALPQELPIEMSTSKNGGANNFMKRKTSNDIENILTSIFNESRNNENFVSNSSSTRKRKLYENVSVQTKERITWDDLGGNFFIGTPKIFRLCSCDDHICY